MIHGIFNPQYQGYEKKNVVETHLKPKFTHGCHLGTWSFSHWSFRSDTPSWPIRNKHSNQWVNKISSQILSVPGSGKGSIMWRHEVKEDLPSHHQFLKVVVLSRTLRFSKDICSIHIRGNFRDDNAPIPDVIFKVVPFYRYLSCPWIGAITVCNNDTWGIVFKNLTGLQTVSFCVGTKWHQNETMKMQFLN